MKNHTSLLNYIALKIKAKSYLEIGTQSCKNFNEIQVPHKVGVDPDLTSPCAVHKTSDDFFKDNKEKFDLIFVDGFHEAEQVKRDIESAYNSLSDKGVILIHDCNPLEEMHTHVPRDSKVWNGDVYKTISRLIYPIQFTVDMDYGCCVIKKSHIQIEWGHDVIDWEFFHKNRKTLLNLQSVEFAVGQINMW